ncbi:uncharacterized protein [Nicotiana tomentosiformis]|uniref:uncharacterized protein n=1 Tax=Nicotiana tomentosiformis TaxID=4098 RepID=UPI00388C7B6F
MAGERVSGATFDEVVDIARHIEMVHSRERVERKAKRPRGLGDCSGVPSGYSPVCVSTSVGNIITVDRVYRSSVVTIRELETRVDLLLLSMVDFDVILGIDWLSLCHAILDYHTKIVTLMMPGLPKVEWRGSLDFLPSMILLLLIQYRSCETFRILFPADLPDMSTDMDIDISIDLVQRTQPNSIPPYRMAPAELRELKEQL